MRFCSMESRSRTVNVPSANPRGQAPKRTSFLPRFHHVLRRHPPRVRASPSSPPLPPRPEPVVSAPLPCREGWRGARRRGSAAARAAKARSSPRSCPSCPSRRACRRPRRLERSDEVLLTEFSHGIGLKRKARNWRGLRRALWNCGNAKICNYGNTQCPCGAGQHTRTSERGKRVTHTFPQFLAVPIHPVA